MNSSSDNPLDTHQAPSSSGEPSGENCGSAASDPFVRTEVHFVGTIPTPTPYNQRPDVPEDLRISWSWIHLFFFLLFTFVSLIIVQTALTLHYAPHKQLAEKELQDYLLSLPQFVVGTTVALFGAMFLFFYVTISVLPAQPFWRSLGWRKLPPTRWRIFSWPWFYFVLGMLLSVIVSIAGSRVHTPDNLPVEALMKTRVGFILMMGMAVFIAPLVEETVFRGYLYPLVVRLVSTSGQHFGAPADKATHAGMIVSVILTGVLFGLLHGAQLSWTWGIVSLLILVGIVFTYVRARTGTVFAGFLMHFGYNLLIALASLSETSVFKNLPPHS